MKKIHVYNISFFKNKPLYRIRIPHTHIYLLKFSAKYVRASLHPNGKAEWKIKVGKYFLTTLSNRETVFLFQLCILTHKRITQSMLHHSL